MERTRRLRHETNRRVASPSLALRLRENLPASNETLMQVTSGRLTSRAAKSETVCRFSCEARGGVRGMQHEPEASGAPRRVSAELTELQGLHDPLLRAYTGISQGTGRLQISNGGGY